MPHSSRRKKKGCWICTPSKFQGQGRAKRDPWPVLRKLGRKRRLSRRDLGE